jgi:hypothetical protein
MRFHRRNLLAAALACLPAAVLAMTVSSNGDYASGLPTGDDPSGTIEALLHGNLAAAAHAQPVMGLTSILLRLPFVGLASILGGGTMLKYRFGVFACAWVAGLVAVQVSQMARERGGSDFVAGLLLILLVLSPLTVGGMLKGHPEELLGGALCLAAVLAGISDRPVLAGLLLGLALGTKEWALVAVFPVGLACRRDWRRMLVVAAAVAAPLALALPLADPHAFIAASRIVGSYRYIVPSSWLWPFRQAQLITTIAGPNTATVHVLPLGLNRNQVAWLPLLAAVPITWRYRRLQSQLHATDLIGVLALLFLIRCTLDPWYHTYYAVPCIGAMLTWELLGTRRLPLATAFSLSTFLLINHLGASPEATIVGVPLTLGLAVYLGRETLSVAGAPSLATSVEQAAMVPSSL